MDTSFYLLIIEKVIHRISNSILSPFDYGDFSLLISTLLVMSIIVLPIGFKSGFLQTDVPQESWTVFFRIALVTLFFPAIAEEMIFRVSLLPHPVEKATVIEQCLWSGISLVIFVIYHPVNAKLFYSAALGTFTNLSFLILSTVLGVACVISYLLSGSLWVPVGIHWLTVITWLLLLGGYRKLRHSHKAKNS